MRKVHPVIQTVLAMTSSVRTTTVCRFVLMARILLAGCRHTSIEAFLSRLSASFPSANYREWLEGRLGRFGTFAPNGVKNSNRSGREDIRQRSTERMMT